MLKRPGLYLVTDRKALKGKDLSKILSGCLKKGLDMVQFRDKEAGDREFLETALMVKKLIAGRALFIINDRVHVALAMDADGVHLGRKDLPLETARKILGKKKIIGCSTCSVKEALIAQKKGADYIAIGAVFKTPVKPDYHIAGIKTLKQAVKKIKVPIVAIGGINEGNIDKVAAAGIKRAAVVRAITGARDPGLAVKKMLEKLNDTDRVRKIK
ncbi:MAG: thiamine phosphate synthase [Candidatus Omnitrophota bacterium]|nr:thiamine phosphate synthase [Candidatus Omnitrophota bacterium]